MEEASICSGDLIILSQAYERYVYERNPNLKVSLVNRLGKIEEVIDWNTDKGRKIEEARVRSGKWKSFSDEVRRDNRYLVTIFYPELRGATNKPIVETTPMFSKNPKTGEAFFQKVPDWIYRIILSKCQTFTIIEEGL